MGYITKNLIVLQKLRVIIQTAHQHSAKIKNKTGVSGAQLWLLQEVYDEQEIKVGDIATKMALKSTTVSNLIESLVELKLLTKTKDKIDKRIVRLILTAKGKKMVDKAPKPTRGLLPDSLLLMNKKELDKLDIALDSLIAQISHLDKKSATEPLPFTL